jgi:hypothetical protein
MDLATIVTLAVATLSLLGAVAQSVITTRKSRSQILADGALAASAWEVNYLKLQENYLELDKLVHQLRLELQIEIKKRQISDQLVASLEVEIVALKQELEEVKNGTKPRRIRKNKELPK